MTAAPQLAIVDAATGELRAAGCPRCAGRKADFDALVVEYTKLLRQRDALLRDRERERELDPQRAEIMSVFDYWRERCGHPRARFDGKRHDLIKGALRRFSAVELKTAIEGAAVDSFVDAAGVRHDKLGLILRDAEKIEDFSNRLHRYQRSGAA